MTIVAAQDNAGVAGGWGYGLIAVRIQPPVRLEQHLTEDQEPLNGGPNFFPLRLLAL